jgi:hypothetical protein
MEHALIVFVARFGGGPQSEKFGDVTATRR